MAAVGRGIVRTTTMVAPQLNRRASLVGAQMSTMTKDSTRLPKNKPEPKCHPEVAKALKIANDAIAGGGDFEEAADLGMSHLKAYKAADLDPQLNEEFKTKKSIGVALAVQEATCYAARRVLEAGPKVLSLLRTPGQSTLKTGVQDSLREEVSLCLKSMPRETVIRDAALLSPADRQALGFNLTKEEEAAAGRLAETWQTAPMPAQTYLMLRLQAHDTRPVFNAVNGAADLRVWLGVDTPLTQAFEPFQQEINRGTAHLAQIPAYSMTEGTVYRGSEATGWTDGLKPDMHIPLHRPVSTTADPQSSYSNTKGLPVEFVMHIKPGAFAVDVSSFHAPGSLKDRNDGNPVIGQGERWTGERQILKVVDKQTERGRTTITCHLLPSPAAASFRSAPREELVDPRQRV